MERVRHALARIERGELAKVVLSRSHTMRCADTPDVSRAVATLCSDRPSCFTYWVRGSETDFFGSTPELLARTKGRLFATESVAGTMPRGRNEKEDRGRAARLLASEKNRREHAAVSHALRQALRSCTTDLQIAPEVQVRSVPEAHHLATSFRGRLDRNLSVLDLAARLHPTPAVCGTPRGEAYDFIRDSDADRGWFSGACGWMDAQGSGELAVALRSGLADGTLVTTSAGAGIVAGSEPDAEYDETEIKMRALRTALEAPR